MQLYYNIYIYRCSVAQYIDTDSQLIQLTGYYDTDNGIIQASLGDSCYCAFVSNIHTYIYIYIFIRIYIYITYIYIYPYL